MNGWHELMIARTHYEELEHDAEVRRQRFEAMERIEHKNFARELVKEVEQWLKQPRSENPEKK